MFNRATLVALAITCLFVSSQTFAQHVADDESPQQKAALKRIEKQAATPQFKQALALVAKVTEQPGTPDDEYKGIVYFTKPADQVEAFLAKHQAAVANAKCMLVRCEMKHGIGGEPDTLALVAASDPWTVMWVFGTNADNYDKHTDAVITWMKDFAKENEITFDTIGFDLCAGRFNKPPADYVALAKKMYEFCPDIVDQGTGSVEKLAEELQKSGRFFFWWD